MATACGVLVAGPLRRAGWQVVAWAAGPLGPRQAAAGRGGGKGEIVSQGRGLPTRIIVGRHAVIGPWLYGRGGSGSARLSVSMRVGRRPAGLG